MFSISVNFLKIRKSIYVLEMLIVRHLGTPNSDFSGCHCMHDPVLYRSMVPNYLCIFQNSFLSAKISIFIKYCGRHKVIISQLLRIKNRSSKNNHIYKKMLASLNSHEKKSNRANKITSANVNIFQRHVPIISIPTNFKKIKKALNYFKNYCNQF